ncbi:MAG: hypothetical protein ACOZAO_01265 [Patescibacteria group bacterium]
MASGNPFNIGYYPGDRKIPAQGRFYSRPYESDFSIYEDLDADIDAAFDKISEAYKLPATPITFVYNNMVADAKRSLRVTGAPRKFDMVDVQASGDEEELAGVTSLKVDLHKMVTQPQKGVSSFVKSMGTEFFSYSDMDLRAERDMFVAMMNGKGKLGFGFDTAKDLLQQRMGKDLSLADETVNRVEKLYDYSGYVKGQASSVAEVDKNINMYEEFTTAFGKFVNDKRSPTARDSSYIGVAQKGADIYKAHLEEIKNTHFVERTIDGKKVKVLSDSLLGSNPLLNSAEDLAQISTTINTAIDEFELATTLGGIGKTINNANKAVSKALREGNEASLDSALKLLDKQLTSAQGLATSLSGAYAQDTISGMTEMVEVFENSVKPLHNFVDDFRKAIFDERTDTGFTPLVEAAMAGDGAALRTLATRIEVFKDRFSGGSLVADVVGKGSLFGDGVERTFLKYLMEERLLKGSKMPDAPYVIEILNSFGIEGGAKIASWMDIAQVMRLRETARDISSQLSSGIFLNNLVWMKVKIRFPITPAKLIEEYLIKRTHGFGLVYDSDYKDLAYAPFQQLMKLGVFSNKLKVDVTINGVVTTLTLQGGKHFEDIDLLNEVLKLGEKGGIENLQRLFGAKSVEELAEMLKDMKLVVPVKVEELYDKIQKLRAFLDKQGIQLSESALYELIQKLSLRNSKINLLKITEEYGGALQKLTSALNVLQSAAFTKLAAVVAPIQYLKKILAELITDAILVASEGIATPLKLAIQYLIIKILDALEAVGKAIIHLDFSSLVSGAEAMFIKLMKWVALGTLPLAGVMAVTIIVIMGMFTTISPIDPTRKVGGCGGGCDVEVEGGPVGDVNYGELYCENFCFFKDVDGFTVGSYRGNDTAVHPGGGHGSNTYWDAVPITLCNSYIPSLGVALRAPNLNADTGGGTFPQDNYCYNNGTVPQGNEFGFAWDVFPVDYQEDSTVCLPSAGDVSYWTVSEPYSLSLGQAVTAQGFAQDGTPRLTIKIQHLGNAQGGDYLPGEAFSSTFNWGNNTHVHIEAQDAGGSTVRPETSGLCSGTPPGAPSWWPED